MLRDIGEKVFAEVYNSSAIEIEDDELNHFVGLVVTFCNENVFRWRPAPKDFACQLVYTDVRGNQPLQHHLSWRPPKNEKATIWGCLAKCFALSFSFSEMCIALTEYKSLCVNVAQIPETTVNSIGRKWAAKIIKPQSDEFKALRAIFRAP